MQLDYLPNGRQVLVVRASGWPNLGDGRRRTSVALLTAGPSGWQVQLEPVAYTPRDPQWRWDEKSVPRRYTQ